MGLFDKIGDVFEDVTDSLVEAAPVILPIALNYFAPGMGTIASSALGSGIGTLISGGSTKDALRNAALAGATGAVAKGIGGLQNNMGFTDAIKADLGQTRNFLTQGGITDPSSYRASIGGSFDPDTDSIYAQDAARQQQNELAQSLNTDEITRSVPLEKPGMISSPFAQGYTDTELMASPEFKSYLDKGFTGQEALTRMQGEYNPSFLSRFGLPAAGITALALSQDPEEEEFFESPLTGADLAYDEDGNLRPEYATDVSQLPPDIANVLVPYERRPMFTAKDGGVVPKKYKGFASLPEAVQMKIDEELAAKYKEGGKAFPRRTGGIGPGEGSGTKDDVPALLMDGEFVMTRDAVKGAGNGSLKKGIAKMYDVMGDLENRARA